MSTIASSQQTQHTKDNKVRIPKQDRAVKAKQAILVAAMEFFSKKGFHKTNSKEIAAAAGVSIGTFYSYYPDKRELFKEAVQLYNCRFNDELYALLGSFDLSARGPAERHKVLRGFIDALILAHRIYEGFHDELIVMHLSDPELHEIVLAKQVESRHNIQIYLERAKDNIIVTDLESASVILYDLVHSVVDTVIFKKTTFDSERILDALVETMDRYLFGT